MKTSTHKEPSTQAYAVVSFDFEADLLERFLAWPRQHYASDSNWLPDPGEARLLSARTNPDVVWRNFLVLQGATVCGRITALVNSRLCDGQRRPFGQLGFFECINDLSAAQLLLDAAVDWLRANAPQTDTILAPINFDTWHPYRLRTLGFEQPTFLMEPYNPSYYPGLLTALGFAPKSKYISKTVNDPLALLAAWQPYHRQAVAQGYHFRSFDPAAANTEMTLIYQLSLPTFRDNLFFAEISEAEFRAMYAGVAGSVDPELLFFVLDPGGEPVGISFSVRDHRQPQTVNLKTFGVLPRVRSAGVGATLAWEAYRRFQAKGFTRVNHCLMRAGNRADDFDRGLAEVTREYTLYARELR